MTCRNSYSFSATILNGAALSDIISFHDYAYGIIHMPAAWDAASLAFQVAPELDGTFQPLYDEAGTLVEIATPVADRSYAVPLEVLAARFVKLWSETAAANVNQTANRTLVIDMKS